MTKKVMISQPMRGKTNTQIRLERADAIVFCNELGYEVLDTVLDISEPPEANPGVFFLGASLQLMSRCDAVYFMTGWEQARGCKIEHDVAVAYGLKVIYGDR